MSSFGWRHIARSVKGANTIKKDGNFGWKKTRKYGNAPKDGKR